MKQDKRYLKKLRARVVSKSYKTPTVFNCLNEIEEKPKQKRNNYSKKTKRRLIKNWTGLTISKKNKVIKPIVRESKRERMPRVYSAYIASKHWTARKNKYYQAYKKRCYRCESSTYIQLHHIYYNSKTYGIEPDESLIPMCRDCHSLFHSLYKTKQNMKKDMLSFEENYPFCV